MQRSNMADSGGWKRYLYERTGVRHSAQTRRSPSATVSQVATLRQISRSLCALQVVMPTIVPHDQGRTGAVDAC